MIRHAFSFSSGIRSIRFLNRFLGVDTVSAPRILRTAEIDATCVLVWGRKETARKPVAWADLHNIPVWFLEDGFIRSCSDKPHSRMSYSLVVDDLGVHYDASCVNVLENFLNSSDEEFNQVYDESMQGYARDCMKMLLANNVTKYNYCRDFVVPDSWKSDQRKIVLVVDQTFDDASVKFGCMKTDDFEEMLEAAIDENPGCRVVVKTHPDVLAGLKRGYLSEHAIRRGVEVIAESVNSLTVLKAIDKVYAGTSQMGFEALLCGKPVVLFGLPFYAGWGVTDDRKSIPRRKQNRTVEQLFFAAYDWYTRYCSPVTGERWSLEECLEHVVLQKSVFAKNSHKFVAYGITPWKRKYIASYLRSPEGSVEFHSGEPDESVLNRTSANGEVILTWGYKSRFLATPEASARPGIVRLEDGFLRGHGLGSDFSPPQSLVTDTEGLYFNPLNNSDLECFLNSLDCNPEDIRRAQRLKNLIISSGLSKYNVGTKNGLDAFDEVERVNAKIKSDSSGYRRPEQGWLLVIGQVENDASIRYGCSDIASNSALIEKVRAENPHALIAFKPHPDVLAGNRPGKVSSKILETHVDLVCATENIVDCIDRCTEVHTMTSLSGFEALLRNKTVVAYGSPFYSGWGLTRDYQSVDRRKRHRTLEELVYCVLIAYPRYLDIGTGEFVTPEELVKSLSGFSHMKNKNITWPERQILKVKNVYKGLSYAP